jgi:hypothetical protein
MTPLMQNIQQAGFLKVHPPCWGPLVIATFALRIQGKLLRVGWDMISRVWIRLRGFNQLFTLKK